MMFALWTAVTLRRPFSARVLEREPGDARRRAVAVMTFRLATTPGTTSCSSPA